MADDSVDHEQALHDLNLSLDVRNDDVLYVQGGGPVLVEVPAKPLESDEGGKL